MGGEKEGRSKTGLFVLSWRDGATVHRDGKEDGTHLRGKSRGLFLTS